MDAVRYNRIQVVLYEFGISQLEMAAILKLNKNTISRWCRNEVQPSLYQFREIAAFFRIDIRDLFEPTPWTNEKGPAPIEIYKKSKTAAKKTAAKKKRVNNRLRK